MLKLLANDLILGREEQVNKYHIIFKKIKKIFFRKI